MPLQTMRALSNREGGVYLVHFPTTETIDGIHRIDIFRQEARMLQPKSAAVLWRQWGEQVLLGPDPSAQRHHHGFTDRIHWRI